jgi:prepilin-type processing-associated H-X9-DG protein
MNAWIAPAPASISDVGLQTQLYWVYNKDSDLGKPGPANTWLFIDENPSSINDGFFLEKPTPTTAALLAQGWIDCPASYHNKACGISFCDGHAQIKKWTDQTVINGFVANGGGFPPTPRTFDRDIQWFVNQVTTASKK